MTDDEKLDLLIEAAQSSPLTFDVLFRLTDNLPDKAFAILCGNVSKLPVYMKSKDIPYLSNSRTAFNAGMQTLPHSQLP